MRTVRQGKTGCLTLRENVLRQIVQNQSGPLATGARLENVFQIFFWGVWKAVLCFKKCLKI